MKIVALLSVIILESLLMSASIVVERFKLIITKEILPGYSKMQVTINGTIPGPTINITFGHWVEVIKLLYIIQYTLLLIR